MAKIKHNNTSDNKKLAKEIIKYWKGQHTREQLKAKLTGMFNTTDKTDKDNQDTGRKVEVDFVFDTELDSQTRLVWIAIPAPDPRANETVAQFVYRYYDSKSTTEKQTLEEDLGKSALFGCGR